VRLTILQWTSDDEADDDDDDVSRLLADQVTNQAISMGASHARTLKRLRRWVRDVEMVELQR
jgi:hypothetical protein